MSNKTYVIKDAETDEVVQPQIGYVDGYTFADTQLEGVMFAVAVEDGKLVSKGYDSSCNEYMADFSEKSIERWKKNALEAALEDMELVTLSGKRQLMIEEVE